MFGNDRQTIDVLLKICYKIPDMETENDVTLAFDILKGERLFTDEDSQYLLLQVVGLREEEASLSNAGWTACKLGWMVEKAKDEKITTVEAAKKIAEERIAAARQVR